ncbi:glycosyltransferase family 2 protein [Patescibacteria group bacterium]|nr:glycosyltransferase family 2 protein [Patescibacteria group bacterium]
MPTLPRISILIPTLNAGSVLKKCLTSVQSQNYPSDKLEIIIADAGSTDNTIKLATDFHCRLIKNKLLTGEAGKAAALRAAAGDYVCLLDSDNILPTSDYLQKTLSPLLSDKKLIGAEPLSFEYRPQAGFIERYSSLLGANDPYAYYCGIYDRFSQLSLKWTGLTLPTIDHPDFLKIELQPHASHPTIGANGTIFRTSFLKRMLGKDQYLFDIDMINRCLKPIYFAKTKNTIIHSFCESSISKFIKKQQRRIRDFYSFQQYRHHQWSSYQNKTFGFALYSLSIVLPLKDSLIGFYHFPDPAWFFHPLACLLTTLVYAFSWFQIKIGLSTNLSRNTWHQ